MQISIDPVVVALQLVPFLLTMVALHFIIFRPMLDYLDQREQARVAGRDEAQALQAGIEEKTARMEGQMAQALSEVVDLKARRRQDALHEGERVVDEARHAAEERVAQAGSSLDAEREAASAVLKGAARQFGDEIAGRVLGRDLKAG